MDATDKTVFLKHTSQRLQKIGRKHPERYEHRKLYARLQKFLTYEQDRMIY